MTDPTPGIYKHHRGGLYQVLFTAALHRAQPAAVCFLFDAIDATRGSEGRRLAVGVWGTPESMWPAVWPTGDELADEDRMVVYFGLTLDGARPGTRIRVRTVEDFTAQVPDIGGKNRPRFRFVSPGWDLWSAVGTL